MLEAEDADIKKPTPSSYSVYTTHHSLHTTRFSLSNKRILVSSLPALLEYATTSTMQYKTITAAFALFASGSLAMPAADPANVCVIPRADDCTPY